MYTYISVQLYMYRFLYYVLCTHDMCITIHFMAYLLFCLQTQFQIGDVVVLCDLHKLIALQSKHNGITDDMCQVTIYFWYCANLH